MKKTKKEKKSDKFNKGERPETHRNAVIQGRREDSGHSKTLFFLGFNLHHGSDRYRLAQHATGQ